MSIVNSLPCAGQAVVLPLAVTRNGTYAPAAGADGFSQVTVNVPSPVPTFAGNFSSASGTRLVGGHILTGLTSSAGFFFPRTPNDDLPSYDMTKPFHIRMKVKGSELMSRDQVLIGDTVSEFARPVIAFGSQGAAYLLQGSFSTDGAAWDTQLSVSKAEMPFVADRWYTVDYAWTDGVFTFTVSDGTDTVTKTAAVSHFTTVADGGTSRVEIGARKGQLYAQNVSVDLLDTCWEQDGVLIWGNRA
ncbi:MAG: hypothetical protein IKI63_02450 [Clostridia bacterium]|nr:hypothetical protein [Clostridia bacterium]